MSAVIVPQEVYEAAQYLAEAVHDDPHSEATDRRDDLCRVLVAGFVLGLRQVPS